MQRLDKILSEAGVASRKELKSLIRAGRVTVDGAVVREEAKKFDEAACTIAVDGAAVEKYRKVLLMTNDGDLAHRILSPRSGVWKTYYAEHKGTASAEDCAAFEAGLTLGDGTKCLPARLEPQGHGKSLIHVQEGKYHQVRRMMAARGMPVTYLKRIAEGGLTLGGLEKLGKEHKNGMAF